MPVEAIAGKILSEHGELTAVVTILHDRTEAIEKAELFEQVKKAAAELEDKVAAKTGELAEQNELLRRQTLSLDQALSLKTQFLANMSHEFRTPLNAILGYTSMLLQGVSGELPPLAKKNLSRVDSNSRHLLAVINDILDISRIEAGRMPIHLSQFKLKELLAEVMSELEPMIQRSTLAVTSTVDAALPQVRSDRKKLKQIVLNLLSNALKFTHTGSIAINGEYDGRSDMVTVSVQDTGIGIAKENHEKVFEDFRQVDDSPTRPYGGTGLGLSICRRLAAMLGGKISLESELEKGSTFTLYVPRRLKRK
jgi:signal transduction histidine kinase